MNNIEILSHQYVVVHESDFQWDETSNHIYIPLYGNIYCGNPNFISDYYDGVIEIPQHMIGPGEYFALRAKGDSMVGADILDGDIVIIKTQNYAEDGQIVVAIIDQEVTLKRYFWFEKEQKYLLHPENEKYKDIITDNCKIMGIAIKILRDI